MTTCGGGQPVNQDVAKLRAKGKREREGSRRLAGGRAHVGGGHGGNGGRVAAVRGGEVPELSPRCRVSLFHRHNLRVVDGSCMSCCYDKNVGWFNGGDVQSHL